MRFTMLASKREFQRRRAARFFCGSRGELAPQRSATSRLQPSKTALDVATEHDAGHVNDHQASGSDADETATARKCE